MRAGIVGKRRKLRCKFLRYSCFKNGTTKLFSPLAIPGKIVVYVQYVFGSINVGGIVYTDFLITFRHTKAP